MAGSFTIPAYLHCQYICRIFQVEVPGELARKFCNAFHQGNYRPPSSPICTCMLDVGQSAQAAVKECPDDTRIPQGLCMLGEISETPTLWVMLTGIREDIWNGYIFKNKDKKYFGFPDILICWIDHLMAQGSKESLAYYCQRCLLPGLSVSYQRSTCLPNWCHRCPLSLERSGFHIILFVWISWSAASSAGSQVVMGICNG